MAGVFSLLTASFSPSHTRTSHTHHTCTHSLSLSLSLLSPPAAAPQYAWISGGRSEGRIALFSTITFEPLDSWDCAAFGVCTSLAQVSWAPSGPLQTRPSRLAIQVRA
jgi:hypothetical protein